MKPSGLFSGAKGAGAGSSTTRLFWIICLLGWATLLAITASTVYVVGFRPLGLVIQMTLTLWLPYLLLTPLVFILVRRFPITIDTWRSAIGIHLLASILFVVVCEGVSLCVVNVLAPVVQQSFEAQLQAESPLVDGARNSPRMLAPLFETSPQSGLPRPSTRMAGVKAVANLPIYWVLAAFSHALLTTARLRERERQAAELTAHLTQAQLAGLRTQLQPHFLFNTLNSISALIPQNARLANEMVLNLSDLLRMTLRDPQRGEIPLSEELKLLGHYVDIQKHRFGKRLVFTLDSDEADLSFPVPPLLLQPLVENAIRYGVEPSEQPEHITVRARRMDLALTLEVTNTCHASSGGFSPAEGSSGVGLANTKARLAALYGIEQTVGYGPLPDGGFRVHLRIPQRRPTPTRLEN